VNPQLWCLNSKIFLQLTGQQIKLWVGKRYLVLIEVDSVEVLDPFPFDNSDFGYMDDWLPVENIKSVAFE